MKLDVTFVEIDWKIINVKFQQEDTIFCTEFQQDNKTFDVNFQQDDQIFNVEFGQIQHLTEYVGGEPFNGDYTVTPKVDSQIMATKGKVMLDDVTVKEIPFFDVTNSGGGSTVYIAKEI